MRKFLHGGAVAVAAVLLLAGCSTLAVKAPSGMFLSTGSYVPDVQTLGIVQARRTVIAPLFFFVDLNKVHQELYRELISKARAAGADGLTNITFTWSVSPYTYLSVFLASGVFDYYIEGVAIKK
jgi:hypothetical protein